MTLRLIMKGVEEDIKDIAHKFHETRTLDYGAFFKIWHEMKFYHIFSGRPCAAEMKVFTHEILLIAKRYALNKCLESEKVIGIYLMYALFLSQPLKYPVRIRITRNEYIKLEEFANQMMFHPTGKYSSFVFYALIYKHAFDYVYSETLYARERLVEELQNESRSKKLNDIARDNERSDIYNGLQESEFDFGNWGNQEKELNTIIDSINKMLKDNTDTSELPQLNKTSLLKGLLEPEKPQDEIPISTPRISATKASHKWKLWGKSVAESNEENEPSTSFGTTEKSKTNKKNYRKKSCLPDFLLSTNKQKVIFNPGEEEELPEDEDEMEIEEENEDEELAECQLSLPGGFNLPSDDTDSGDNYSENDEDVDDDL